MSSVGILNLLYDCIAGAGNKGENGVTYKSIKKIRIREERGL